MSLDLKNFSVILPSYKPDEKLLEVIKGLEDKGFQDIIVINDGSGEEFDPIFKEASSHQTVTLLTHEVNQGKGRGLKTAFQYVVQNRPEGFGVVTVDGDNQHHPEDIYATCAALQEHPDCLILGARNFSKEDIPFRSRFGNNMTSFVFRFACGIKITDTQTGLRAIHTKYLPMLSEIAGERYEYETNMLLETKNAGISLFEVPIRTIYIDDNDSSHFHPLRDSFKIYRTIFAFLASSIISCVVDLALFYIFMTILSYLTAVQAPGISAFLGDTANVFIATGLARILSSICNYTLNRKKVFKKGNRTSLLRYYTLCVVQFLASAGLVALLTALLPFGNLGKTIIKALVDTLLFLISYQIQREWVFAHDQKK